MKRRSPDSSGGVGDVRTRKDFLLTLCSSAAAISGYFLLASPAKDLDAPQGSAHSFNLRPALRPNLEYRREGPLLIVTSDTTPPGNACAVNSIGATVLQHLNGRHTIADLAQKVAAAVDIRPDEVLEAKLAFFVAQLGMLGLLVEPFYACVVETWTAES